MVEVCSIPFRERGCCCFRNSTFISRRTLNGRLCFVKPVVNLVQMSSILRQDPLGHAKKSIVRLRQSNFGFSSCLNGVYHWDFRSNMKMSSLPKLLRKPRSKKSYSYILIRAPMVKDICPCLRKLSPVKLLRWFISFRLMSFLMTTCGLLPRRLPALGFLFSNVVT